MIGIYLESLHLFPLMQLLIFQKTASLPFSHFDRTQQKKLLYNPFFDYKNQSHFDPNVTNQRSHDQTLKLNTINTTVSELSRLPLPPLNTADTYSKSSFNNELYQINIKMNANSNPSQTLYQPRTASCIGLSATLPSSSFVRTVKPINSSSVITQNFTVPFVAFKKLVETLDGLDHHYNS